MPTICVLHAISKGWLLQLLLLLLVLLLLLLLVLLLCVFRFPPQDRLKHSRYNSSEYKNTDSSRIAW